MASAASFLGFSDLGLGLNLDLGELNNDTRLLGTLDLSVALFLISLSSVVVVTFLSMAGGVVTIFSGVDFGVVFLDLVRILFLTLGLNNFFLVSKTLGLGVVVVFSLFAGANEVLGVSRIFGSSAGDSTIRNGTC